LNKDGLDLELEKEFLGVKNIKAYLILKELATTTGSLDNKTMATKCGMSLRSYADWKNHLVFCGLLQLRQLNATTYFISLGSEAIEKDDLMHMESDYLSMVQKVCGINDDDTNFDLEEEDFEIEFVPKYNHEPKLMKESLELDKKFPMPNEDEIF